MMKAATVVCSAIGAVIGVVLTIVGIVFGIFACIPAGPFEHRDLGICVSFLVLSSLSIVLLVCALIGACMGLVIDLIVDD